jgi:hypothetical protein
LAIFDDIGHVFSAPIDFISGCGILRRLLNSQKNFVHGCIIVVFVFVIKGVEHIFDLASDFVFTLFLLALKGCSGSLV